MKRVEKAVASSPLLRVLVKQKVPCEFPLYMMVFIHDATKDKRCDSKGLVCLNNSLELKIISHKAFGCLGKQTSDKIYNKY